MPMHVQCPTKWPGGKIGVMGSTTDLGLQYNLQQSPATASSLHYAFEALALSTKWDEAFTLKSYTTWVGVWVPQALPKA